jgi:WD40 repeat protein
MYKIQTIIPGLKNVPSYISELAFNPTGSILGATFSQFDNNCGVLDNSVRLYDTKSTKIIKELRNPLSQLNHPHAILLTNKHIIVSNKGTSPSNLLTFRIKDKTNLPSDNYLTPFKKLNEAHSFAIFNQLLLVTYCEKMDKRGAIVSYQFDDNHGKIVKVLDKLEDWFNDYGDAKGIAFDKKGSKIYITFGSDKLNIKGRISWLIKRIVSLGVVKARTTKNGIAVFDISSQGKISKKPKEIYLFNNYPRFENIHIVGNRCLLTDALNNTAFIFNLKDKKKFAEPLERITQNLHFPHGGKLSPDGKIIAISNFGIKVKKRRFIQWGEYFDKRKDNITLFRAANKYT